MTTPLTTEAELPALEEISALYEEMTSARIQGRLAHSDWEDLIAKSVQAETSAALAEVRDEFKERAIEVE